MKKNRRFFQWIDSNFNNPRTRRKNLLVYPEGHRNFGSEKPLTLKKGMIQYAYERKVKVQIVISFGNENIINEKNFIVNFEGANIMTYVGEVIDPKTFKTCEEFIEETCKAFYKDFNASLTSYKTIYNNNVKN